VIRLQNEKLAAICAEHPDRFAAFASVALQFPEMAADQLEEGVKKHKLRGAAIGGHVNGDELSAPKFDPFWKKAEELGCLVFMHPQGIPELNERLEGKGGLTNVIGNPLETTIFLSHLIFDGTLDRFPGLKICASRGGGYLPSYSARSDYGCVRFPDTCKSLKKHPTEYLRQIYVDSMVFTPEGLPAALGRGMRREPDHDRHRLPVSVEHHHRGSRPEHARPERRRPARDPGRERGEAVGDRFGAQSRKWGQWLRPCRRPSGRRGLFREGRMPSVQADGSTYGSPSRPSIVLFRTMTFSNSIGRVAPELNSTSCLRT
jgi:hypothetical protein